MKVSVIIPVYNAEPYLRECLDSVIGQTCNDLEILLLDDASADRSGEICDAYAAQYPQVRAVHLEHCGVGAVRNEGLRLAQGEYIVFADADDMFAAKDCVQKMADILDTTKADIAVGNYCRLWDGDYLEATRHSAFSGMDPGSGTFRFCGFFSVGTLSYVWGKAYRSSFLKAHGIVFDSYKYAEDKAFNFRCYAEQARYAFLDDTVYVYRKNNASISNQVHRDRSESWLRISSDLKDYLDEKNLYDQYGDLVSYTVNFAAFFDGKAQYCKSGHELAAVRELLKKYCDSPVAHHSFGQLARGNHIRSASGLGWKVCMWGFALLMRMKAVGLLAIGIKLLIDLRVDERLSDTGIKKK